jgi:hypothetical protein
VSVEISRVAHFSGEGLVTPTEVLRTSLGDGTSVYFLSPYDRNIKENDPREPSVALVVEEVNKNIKDLPETGQFENSIGARLPDLQLTVESEQDAISLKHLAMLTYAALRGTELKDIAIVGRSEDEIARELYKEYFGMHPGRVLSKPGGVDGFIPKQGYVGQREEIVGLASHALRKSNITVARYLPDEDNKAAPSPEIAGF